MPRPIETADMHDFAVLEVKVGVGPDGEGVFDDPVEIRCRWEEATTQVRLANQETITLDATVVVDRDIPMGSLLWNGELADFYGSGSAIYGAEIMQSVYAWRIPSIDGRNVRRVLGLQRFRERNGPQT